jgi:hypothetical protein
MFLLDGKPLAPDVPFVTPDGTRYPANWLRLSTLEEKEAIGITEVPDPPTWDQRWAWGYDAEGHLIWKDHTQLVEQWTQQTRTTAGTLLDPTDWMVIRQTDNGTEMPLDWKLWRELVRIKTGEKVTAITATTTTEELAAYITGPDYPVWPPDPSQPQPTPPDPVVNDMLVDSGTDVTSAE